MLCFNSTGARMGCWCHKHFAKHPPLVWLNGLAVAIGHNPLLATSCACACTPTFRALQGFAQHQWQPP